MGMGMARLPELIVEIYNTKPVLGLAQSLLWFFEARIRTNTFIVL